MPDTLSIRPAGADELPLVLEFIRELAAYERLEHEVVATTEDLAVALLGPRAFAEVVLPAWTSAAVVSASTCSRGWHARRSRAIARGSRG